MATESLIIELDARTAKAEAKIERLEKSLDGVDGKTKKTDKSLASFGRNLSGVAIAATAAAASVAALVVSTSRYARELEVAATRSGETVERMQALAFATGTVGISLEKLGDISKDTQEKIGEFLATGGGGFKDFVDVLGLTNAEAQKVAEQLETLSGPEVLKEMVRQLESAGISGQRMSFALEGVASDATDLIPLLINNAAGLDKLETTFNDLDSTLTQLDIDKIKLVGEEFDKLNQTFSNESKQLVADYSDELIKAFAVIGAVAEGFADLGRVITESATTPFQLASAAISDFINGTDTLSEVLSQKRADSIILIDDLFNSEGLGEKLAEFSDSVKMQLNEALGVDLFEVGVNAGKSLADGIKEGADIQKPLEILISGGKELTAWEKLNSKERLGVQQKFIKASQILANEYLEENKAINQGLIIADTAAGIMMAFRSAKNPYEAYANAAIIAATGLVQLTNASSASKGGGSISAGSSSGSSASPSSQPAQQDFQPETDTLEFTDSTSSGSTTQTITFASDTGDDLVNAIAEALNNKMIRE